MKYIVALLLLVPAFNLCRAELTLPKTEKTASYSQPKKQEKDTLKQKSTNEALIESARKMHLRGIYNALIAGADINNLDKGFSALHIAIYVNSPETVKYIIKCGADVNIKDRHNFTPILYASKVGNIEIIDMLLENGADINSKNGLDSYYQIKKGDKIIYQFKYEEDALSQANNLNIIKYLIHKEYKINGKNLSPVLLNAAEFNDMPTIKYIVAKGRKYKDFNMTPALILTVEEGFPEAMQYLLANGATIPDIGMTTPNREIYNYLQRKNVNIEFDPDKPPITFIEKPDKNKTSNKAAPKKANKK